VSAALVGPLGTITFDAAGGQVRQVYTPPRNTCDLRARLCTDHHPACDCREAEWAEDRAEHRWEREEMQRVTWQALEGHQLDPPVGRYPGYERMVCQCSGCTIVRATWHTLLPYSAVDLATGRVLPYPRPPAAEHPDPDPSTAQEQ
jgi:hypothetical protein